MTTILTPLQHARRLAGRQHAAIARHQARLAGLSERQIDGLLSRGDWERAAQGVLVVAGSPDTPLRRLWVAYLTVVRAGGVVSDQSAAALDGLLPPSLLPHVTVAPGSSARSRAARVHRRLVPGRDTRRTDGLRVTTPSRTLVDLAGSVDRPTLESVVDDAFCRRLATSDSTLAALGRAGACTGAGQLREVVGVWTPQIRPDSVAEVRLLRRLLDLGARDVVTQYEVRDPDGAFVARLDVAVPALRVGLEYDGALAHNPRRWEHDQRRSARLALMDWSIATVDKTDLLPGSTRLQELVAGWTAGSAA